MASSREIPELPVPQDAGDSRAFTETQAFANAEDLERIERTHAHRRREIFRQHYHFAVLIVFWGFFSVLMIAGIAWAFHLLTPDQLHFLTPPQLDRIQSTFFSGLISAGLSIAIKAKYLE